MPTIEPNAVTDPNPLHCPAQIGLHRLQQEMKMILHQHIRMNLYAESLAQFPKQLQKVESIRLGPEDGLPFFPPGGDMIASTRSLDAQCPCHHSMKARTGSAVNQIMSNVEM